MARQVLQVKRKNSTNWICSEARLTVAGSVASRLGPREVATGCGSTGSVAVKFMGGCTTASGVAEGTSTKGVAAMEDPAGASVPAGEQADANKTLNRAVLSKIE